MNANEAAEATKLTTREMTGEKNPFLRCQLGRLSNVRREGPTLWNADGSKIIQDAYDICVEVFHLVAFGENWEKAVKMADGR